MQPPFVSNPTYILAPNWTFVPGGPIDLGNIVADPFRPHMVLTRPDPEASPSIQRHVDENWQLHLASGSDVTVGLWVKFVDLVGVKLGLAHRRRLSTAYNMTALETVYYTDMPTMAQVKERVRDPDVKELMRPDNPFSKPVFMITGIKIARGFSLSAGGSSADGGTLGAEGPAGSPATVGGNVGVAFSKGHNFGFDSKGDIVFAYQLMVIKPKGWKNKTFKLAEYHSSAAFLGDDEDEEDPEPEVELDLPEVQDFKTVNSSITDTTVADGQTECICIAFGQDAD